MNDNIVNQLKLAEVAGCSFDSNGRLNKSGTIRVENGLEIVVKRVTCASSASFASYFVIHGNAILEGNREVHQSANQRSNEG